MDQLDFKITLNMNDQIVALQSKNYNNINYGVDVFSSGYAVMFYKAINLPINFDLYAGELNRNITTNDTFRLTRNV